MTLHSGPLPNDRITDGFQLFTEARQWLEAKGRRQRIANTTLQTYQDWQRQQANYAVFDGEQIAGVYSVVREEFRDWPEFQHLGKAHWLRGLVTHPDYRRSGVGKLAIQAALDICGNGTELYLDCVSGFLTGYYQDHGFECLAHRTISDASGAAFEITLLRHLNREGKSTTSREQ